MSAYKELIERCAKAYADSVEKTLGARVPANGARREAIEATIAEVLRTLEMVTPEMELAGGGWALDGYHAETWRAMLHASPLNSTPRSNCS